MKVLPLRDRILVKQEQEPEKTQGGLYLPDNAKETPQWGEVVSVGPGIFEKGEMRPLAVKKGDRVLFGKYSGTKVKVDKDELLFMREEDILAVVED